MREEREGRETDRPAVKERAQREGQYETSRPTVKQIPYSWGKIHKKNETDGTKKRRVLKSTQSKIMATEE